MYYVIALTRGLNHFIKDVDIPQRILILFTLRLTCFLYNYSSFLSGYEICYTLRYTSTIFFNLFQVIIKMMNKNNDCENKREKLYGFENWPQ